MRVDLHTHSNASDGTLSPAELAAAAGEAGIGMLALTDHDTIAGFDALRDTAHGLTLVPGVELSVIYKRRVVHVVGLGFDPDDEELRAALAGQREARTQRASQIAQRLTLRGAPDLLSAAAAIAGHAAPGRVHFAAALVAAGVVSNSRQAFRRLLGDGKPAHVRGDWLAMDAAVAIIHGAGGTAVLAHPLTYQLTATGLSTLVTAFADTGGDAVEWADTQAQPALAARLARLVTSLGLRVSSGSDFHGPGQPWRRLGRTDSVPAGLATIYDAADTVGAALWRRHQSSK